MDNNRNNIIEKIISDDVCLEKILKADTDDRLKEIFLEYGLNLSDEQIELLKNEFKEKLKNTKKLDAKTLDQISAGTNNERLKYAALEGIGNGGYYGLWSGMILGATAGITDASLKVKKGKIDSSWDFIKEVLKTSIKSSLIACMAGAACKTTTSVISEAVIGNRQNVKNK